MNVIFFPHYEQFPRLVKGEFEVKWDPEESTIYHVQRCFAKYVQVDATTDGSWRLDVLKVMFEGGSAIAHGHQLLVVSGASDRCNESVCPLIGARAISKKSMPWKGNLIAIKYSKAAFVVDAKMSDLQIIGDYLRDGLTQNAPRSVSIVS